MRRLLKQGLEAYEHETNINFNSSHKKKHQTKFLVPYHIYKAIQNQPKFDFLLNQYLGNS